MSRLLLLRHARAGWAHPGMSDFDRPLTASGEWDAADMAATMHERGLVPDLVLCSTARRARQTWSAFATVGRFSQIEARFHEAFYAGDATSYLQIIQDAARAGSLLLIGHNPMIEDLAFALAGEGDPQPMMALRRGMPTTGLAVLTLADSKPIRLGSARLDAFLAPNPAGARG